MTDTGVYVDIMLKNNLYTIMKPRKQLIDAAVANGSIDRMIPQWQKDLAGWADKKWIFRTCEFKDFTPRKGFKCREYF